jgi:hypothetical protein
MNLEPMLYPPIVTVSPRLIKWTVVLVVIVTLLMMGLLMKSCHSPQSKPTAINVAKVAPAVIKEKKVEVVLETPAKSIRVYTPTAKKKLPIPQEVIEDNNKHVTSASTVLPRERRQVVTQVIDVTTGETEVFISDTKQPWVALENRGSLSMDYGYKRGNPSPVGRINLRQDFIQLKSLHLGISASGYTDGDYFVGVGGNYRW